MPTDPGFTGAASRQIPPEASPLLNRARRTPTASAIPPASGPNRHPVLTRRRISSAQPQHPTFCKPFSLPAYLTHSTFASQFFTTPTAESVYSSALTSTSTSIGEPSAKPAPVADDNGVFGGTGNLSEGLGGGQARAAKPGNKGAILLPSCWDALDSSPLLEVSSDGLDVSFAGSAKYGDRDAASVRSNRPIPSQAAVYYFEVKILDRGQSGYIGIGFSHRSVSLGRLPGWEKSSWGYHGDDGRAFCCLGTGERFGPTFTTGDTIGCGVDFSGGWPESSLSSANGETHKDCGRAFFTKNGDFLGYAFSNLDGNLYPSVGLRTPREAVRANFGSDPFVFDIDSLVRERKRAVLDKIASTPVPASLILPPPLPIIPSLLPTSQSEQLNETLQTLITSYLIHHGYSSTASSFASQVHLERLERSKGLLPPSLPSLFSSSPTMAPGADSSQIRGEIRAAFFGGDADRVLELSERHYPLVVAPDPEDPSGGLRFKLRTRAFVEAVVRALPPPDGKGKEVERDGDVRMASEEEGGEGGELDEVVRLGRELKEEYREDEREEVQRALEEAFSLLAYRRVEEMEGKRRWLVGMDAREALADELNSAILVSLSLPPIPHLEAVFRQASAVVGLLGDSCGSGGAALVDVRREVLSG